MYCKNCGANIKDGSTFCTTCGAAQNSFNNDGNGNVSTGSRKGVGFIDAVKLFFQNYANFEGRATRSEYWWAWLFTFLIGCIPVVGYVASLACLIPGIAVFVRRLHDIGRPWYHLFIGFIPLVGAILLLVWMCQDSTGDNQWGPAPQ